VINSAEPDDDQIVIAQVRHLTDRRDESHRLLAGPSCRSSVQAEKYLAVISGPIPVTRPASANIAVITDLPSLGDGPGDSWPSPGQAAGSPKICDRVGAENSAMMPDLGFAVGRACPTPGRQDRALWLFDCCI
jgi:hypothetical protein